MSTKLNYRLAKSKQLNGRILVPIKLNISCLQPLFPDILPDGTVITTTQTIKFISYMQGNELIIAPVENGLKLSELVDKYLGNLNNSNDILTARAGNVTKKMLRLTTAAESWLKKSNIALKSLETTRPPILKEISESEIIGIASKSEEEFLVENINYYLDLLHLRSIDIEKTTWPIHYISTIGDSEVKKAYFKYIPNRKYQNEILSNQNMKSAMMRLGFYELHDLDNHLVGSLYEALFAIAIMQESIYAISVLENALFGNPIVLPDYKIVFKSDKFKE